MNRRLVLVLVLVFLVALPSCFCEEVMRDVLGIVPPIAASDVDLFDAKERLNCASVKKGSREERACELLADFEGAGAVESWPERGSVTWYGENVCPSLTPVPVSTKIVRISKGAVRVQAHQEDYFGEVPVLPYGFRSLMGSARGETFERETRDALTAVKKGKHPGESTVAGIDRSFESSDGGPFPMAKTPGKSVVALYGTYIRQKGKRLLVFQPGGDAEGVQKGCASELYRIPDN